MHLPKWFLTSARHLNASRPARQGKAPALRRVGALLATLFLLISITVPSQAQVSENPTAAVSVIDAPAPEVPDEPRETEPTTPVFLGLSPEFVTIHDKLTILGLNLAGLEDDYKVLVGGFEAYPEVWSDTEIRFPMPTVDPGPQNVTLEPKPIAPPPASGFAVTKTATGGFTIIKPPTPTPTPLPTITVGTVTVAKYVLPEGEVPVPEIVKVRLAPGATPEEVAIEHDGFEPLIPAAKAGSLLSRWWKVRVPLGTEKERILAYATLDKVEVAEYAENRYELARRPTDFNDVGSDQWGIFKARFTAAWEVRIMGSNIAFLDSGVSLTHEDMTGVVVTQRDYTGTGLLPCDSHGTGVASVAAANTNNSLGIAGAAWMARVGDYKVFSGANCNTLSINWSQAITQAVLDGFRIINMSFVCTVGVDCNLTSDQNVITAAWDAGAFLVAAAGNNNSTTARYPANYQNVFAVASSRSDDTKATHSNYGGWVDLAAPGLNIRAADIDMAPPNRPYSLWTGTSVAAPLVAGAASILRAEGLSNTQIRDRLQQNADPINWAGGSGRLNAYRALRPQQGCIRDIPIGAWVSADGAVWQVAGPNLLRGFAEGTSVDSWKAWPDVVTLCNDRFQMMAKASSIWGYRPGTLVSAPGYGVYLITTDGDRGLPNKRHITSPDVFNCLGWQWSNILTGSGAVIDSHPTGPPIDSCSTLPGVLPRSFPNGTIIRSPGGTIYVMEAGRRRGVPDIAIYNSWFGPTEWVQATQTEMDLIAEGTIWGFRQGRIIQPSGSSGIYFITDDGAERAVGLRRGFMDPTTINERGYGSVSVTGNINQNVANIHREIQPLDNADNMP